MTPITFLGKRYYIVHNGEQADDAACYGCVFQERDYVDCPNGRTASPLHHACNDTNRIYIRRTKQAVANWVAWRLEGFPKKEGT